MDNSRPRLGRQLILCGAFALALERTDPPRMWPVLAVFGIHVQFFREPFRGFEDRGAGAFSVRGHPRVEVHEEGIEQGTRPVP